MWKAYKGITSSGGILIFLLRDPLEIGWIEVIPPSEVVSLHKVWVSFILV
jgi:hypothetical protein